MPFRYDEILLDSSMLLYIVSLVLSRYLKSQNRTSLKSVGGKMAKNLSNAPIPELDSPSLARKGSFDITEVTGPTLSRKGSFDITEFDSPTLSRKGSFDITELTSPSLARKGSFDITEVNSYGHDTKLETYFKADDLIFI
ncbi:hypothetical protein [Microvirga calopogonii]|uniref:hypothetical protein n=1 Tax=Microvirga calopogonii TaxID=2078013 RepID=UPI0013B40F56|nr:hypothetical protein [Microvirga calopogonii]